MEHYWEPLRQRVCAKCIDGDGKGNCRLPHGEACALEAFLPELVTIVSTVKADSYQKYVEALRATVCAQCDHQVSGRCNKRETLECALDRYFPVVLEVMETVKEELAKEKPVEASKV